jgi:hypothetical protein
MATLTYGITVSEIQLDGDYAIVAEHLSNLPHADRIAKQACESWNAIDFAGILNGVLGASGVESAKMTSFTDGDERLRLVIKIVAKRGFRLSERRRNAIFDELDAQMTDGWGEGFFGYGNVTDDGNGGLFMPA